MFDFIAKPFGALLMLLYNWVGNYGVAIILFALIVKLILLPFQMKSKRGMMQTQRLQPKMEALKRKHGANQQKYNEEVQKMYREEGVKPMAGCLWTLLPFPILLALYSAVRQPLTMMMGVGAELVREGGVIFNKLKLMNFSVEGNAAYDQIGQSKFIADHFDQFAALSDKLRQIDYNFLGIDLSRTPQWNLFWAKSADIDWLPGVLLFLIPIISGLLTFFTSKVTAKISAPAAAASSGAAEQQDPQQRSMKMMTFMMPLLSVYIGFIMPAALGMYWIMSSLFGLIQDIWLTKRFTKILDAEDAVRREQQRIKDAQLEEKRRETERKKAENATERNPNTSKARQKAIEKTEQQKRAAGWEGREQSPAELEPSREGERRFARGRAYASERYGEDYETQALDGDVLDGGEDGEYPEDGDVIDITDEVEEIYDGGDEENAEEESEAARDEEE